MIILAAVSKVLSLFILGGVFLAAMVKFVEAIRLDLPTRLSMLHLYETGLIMLLSFALAFWLVV